MGTFRLVRTHLTAHGLLYVVAVTGSAILAVEVMAVRFMAPYFGNTVYSFSSVLSVILAALALGYFRGGRLADKRPDPAYFFRLVALAGLSILVVQLLGYLVLPLVSYGFSVTSGPLVAAAILYFVPGYLFGLLSPYVVKLRSLARPEEGIGSVAGEVFFASTLGSIAGSLLAGFVLVPHLGLTYSMLAMGGAIALLGLVGMHLLHARSTQHILGLVAVVVVLVGAVLYVSRMDELLFAGTLVYSKDGVYSRINVVEGSVFGEQGRVLILDRTLSSGVTLPGGDLLFPYTKYYRFAEGLEKLPQQVLVLGAGAGTVAKAFHEAYPDAHIDMVDVEPRLFTLAYSHFFLPTTERIENHLADGRQFLRQSEGGYDVVFGDIYASLYNIPWHVMTKEYYELLSARMNEGGLYIGNYIGATDRNTPSLVWSSVATLQSVFDDVDVYPVVTEDDYDVQNIILVARKGASLDAVRALNEQPDRSDLFAHRIRYKAADLEKHLIFTDDRAPVDLYTMALSDRY